MDSFLKNDFFCNISLSVREKDIHWRVIGYTDSYIKYLTFLFYDLEYHELRHIQNLANLTEARF